MWTSTNRSEVCSLSSCCILRLKPSSTAYSPPPRSSTPTLSDRMRPPTQQNALNVAICDSSRPKSIPPGTPMTPVYKPQTPTFAAHPPPPPAGPAPAMPPPCPLPEIPQGLNVESTRPAPEASVEEKRKLWEERTKCVQAGFFVSFI